MHNVQRKNYLRLSDLSTSALQRPLWKPLLLGFTLVSVWILFCSNPLQDYILSPDDCVILKPPGSELRNPAYLIRAKHGAVASENKRCSDIGVNVLKDGGNAVDAAIAVTFCIGVVNMFSWVLPSP